MPYDWWSGREPSDEERGERGRRPPVAPGKHTLTGRAAYGRQGRPKGGAVAPGKQARTDRLRPRAGAGMAGAGSRATEGAGAPSDAPPIMFASSGWEPGGDGFVPVEAQVSAPGLAGLEVSLRTEDPYAGARLVGEVALPAARLRELLARLSIEASGDANAIPGRLVLLDPASVRLGLSLDLSGLVSGDGRFFAAAIDLEPVLGTLSQLSDWLAPRLGIGADGAGASPTRFLHVDGPLLRIYDPDEPDGSTVGFDIAALATAADPASLAPVELRAVAGRHGSVSYGAATEEGAPGQALAPRPPGKALMHDYVELPASVAGRFGLDPGTVMTVRLFIDGETAHIWAHRADGERGLLVTLHYGEIARGVGRHVKLPGLESPGSASALRIDQHRSRQEAGLAVAFSSQADNGSRGHVLWRLGRFVAGTDLSPASLVPDVLHVENQGTGALALGMGISLAGRRRLAEVPLPGSVADALGVEADVAGLYSGGGDGQLGFALAVVDGDADGQTAPGIEVALDEAYVDRIEANLRERVAAFRERVASGLARRREGAGEGGAPGRLGLDLVDRGLRVSWTAGEREMYATFGYAGLVDVATGQADIAALTPVELQVGGETLSVGVEPIEADTYADQPVPDDARRVGDLPPIVRDPLTALGLSESQWLQLDRDASELLTGEDDEEQLVRAVGRVFDADEDGTVTGGRRIEVTVDLIALVEAMVPEGFGAKLRQRLQRRRRDRERGVDVGLGATDEGGVELSIAASGRSKTLELRAGWSLSKLLDILMSLDELADEPQILAPDSLTGRFESKAVAIVFEAGGSPEPSEHAARVTDIPGLPTLLGQFFEPPVIEASRLYFHLPDPKAFARAALDPLQKTGRVPIAGVALQIQAAEGADDVARYALTLEISRTILMRLAATVSGLGPLYKALESAYSLIEDPAGTVESMMYAPEALEWIIQDGTLGLVPWEDMSAHEIAMLVMMNDASIKESVMLRRALDRLGIEPGAATREELMQGMANQDRALRWSKWINSLEPAQIEAYQRWDQFMRRQGIEVPDMRLEEIDYEAIVVDPAAIDARIELIEESYASVRDFDESTATDAEREQKANELAVLVERFVEKGVTRSPVAPPEATGGAPAAGEVDEPEHISEVGDLPDATEKQHEDAAALFEEAPGGIVGAHRDYLIQKYAHLTTTQLANLLRDGSVSAELRGRARVIDILDDERGFVRSLFLSRTGGASELETASDAGLTPEEADRQLAQAWFDAGQPADIAVLEDEANERAAGGDGATAGTGTSTGGSLDDLMAEPGASGPHGEKGTESGGELDETSGTATSDRGTTRKKGGAGTAEGPTSLNVTVGGAEVLTRWDPTEQRLVLNTANVDKAKQRRWIGGTRRIEHITVDWDPAGNGNVAAPGDPPLYEYRIVVDSIATDGSGETFRDEFDFFFQPPFEGKAGKHTEWTTSAVSLEEFSKLFKLQDGKATLRSENSTAKVGGFEGLIISADDQGPYPDASNPLTDEQGRPYRRVYVVYKITHVDRPGSRKQNASGKMQVLEKDRPFAHIVTIPVGSR